MPRKIRSLIQDLESAGFADRGGKGSHRNFMHSHCPYVVTISGKTGDDAKPYQEKAIKRALQAASRGTSRADARKGRQEVKHATQKK